jgi:phenylpropionate dioxygenase-like ring-hydroxylating dioxygenase large terminal subunit
MRLTTLSCREAHGLVWVWWGRQLEPDALPDLPWLPEIPPAALAAVCKSFVWPVPTSRAVESVFDEHHAPVLHGRGSLLELRRAVDVRSTESGDRIDRIEHTGRMTTADATGRSLPFRVISLQPGLTYLWIDPYVNLAAFDTPVDAGNTWRWYRTFAGEPVGPVRRAAENLIDMVLMEIVQNREDLWMVRTQSHVQEGVFHDMPVAADSGVKLLMRQRRRLLQEATNDRSAYPRHVQQRLEPPDQAEPGA